MTSISADQNALSSLTAFSGQNTASVREAQAAYASVQAQASSRSADQLSLTPEAAEELRLLKQRDREVRTLEREGAARALMSQDPSNAPKVRKPVERKTDLPDAARENEQDVRYVLTGTSQKTESDRESARISWAHGTYQVGRRSPSTRFYFSPNDQSVQSHDQGTTVRHAQRSYSVMSRQGLFSNAIVPHGIGISIMV